MSDSLYHRLGGYDGISKIINDAVDNHLQNPAVKSRFEAVEDLDHAKKMGTLFFCAGAGGPEEYTGKDLRTAHQGMNISEQELVEAMDDIVEAMDSNGVGDAEKMEVIAILYTLKDDVVRL